jgi:hypothetical protein
MFHSLCREIIISILYIRHILKNRDAKAVALGKLYIDILRVLHFD